MSQPVYHFCVLQMCGYNNSFGDFEVKYLTGFILILLLKEFLRISLAGDQISLHSVEAFNQSV